MTINSKFTNNYTSPSDKGCSFLIGVNSNNIENDQVKPNLTQKPVTMKFTTKRTVRETLVILMFLFNITIVLSQPQVLFSENFETPPTTIFSMNNWSIETGYANSGTNFVQSDLLSIQEKTITSNSYLVQDPVSSSVILSFWHVCLIEEQNLASVEYQINGGIWTTFNQSNYTGSALNYTTFFNKESYSAWVQGGRDYVNESFQLNNVFAGDEIRVRFRILSTQQIGDKGWSIDDIQLKAFKPCDISFSCAEGACSGSELQINNLIYPSGATGQDVSWEVNGVFQNIGEYPVYTFNSPGSYLITANVAASEGCSASTYSQTIEVSGQSSNIITATSGASCGVYNFSVDLPNPTGIWSFGDGYFSDQETPQHSYAQNGTYTCSYIINGNYCPLYYTFTVNTLPQADFNYQVIDACNNLSGVQLSISNFDDVAYDYFFEINGMSQSVSSATATYQGFNSGINTIKLKVLSSTSCIGIMQKNIYFNNIIASFNLDAEACQGQTLPLSSVVSGANSYDWQITSPGAVISNYNGQYPSVVLNESGTYSIELTTQAGNCPSSSQTGAINVNPFPNASFSLVENCGSVTVTMDNMPITPFNFSINYGDGTVINSGTFANELSHTYSNNGIFNLEISLNTNGCSSSASNSVLVNSMAGVSISGSNVVCGNESQTLTAVINNLDQSIGTGGISYEWFEVSNPTTILSTNSTLNVSQSGTYGVTITSNGSLCISANNSTALKLVTQYSVPEVLSYNVTSFPTCNGGTGSANLTLQGPIPPEGYSVNGGAVNYSTTITVNNLHPGVNHIIMANGQNNNCTQIFTIELPTSGVDIVTSLTQPSCNSSDGTIQVTNSGVSEFKLYSATYVLLGTNSTGNFSNYPAGAYIIEIELNNGCVISDEVILSGNTIEVELAETSLLSSCSGALANIEALVSYSNGQTTSGASFNWYDLDGATPGIPLTNHSDNYSLDAGHYRVEAIENGCSDYFDFDITSLQGYTVEIETNGQLCQGEAITISSNVFGGNEPYSYFWDGVTAPTTSAIVIAEGITQETQVSLQVVDQNGCMATSNTLIIEAISDPLSLCSPSDPNISIPLPLVGCDFEVCAQGGTSPYVFEWYLQGQVTDVVSTMEFTFDQLTGDVLYNSTIVTPPNAPANVIASFISDPVPFNLSPNDPIMYKKWAYNGTSVVPRFDSEGNLFTVQITTPTIGEFLQYSHVGNTASTAEFESGNYRLRIIDSKGCEISYDPIIIEKPVALNAFPGFQFAFLDKSVDVEEEEVVKVPSVIQNMAEATQSLENASQACMASQQQASNDSYQVDCFSLSSLVDEFNLNYTENIYNYTLYYYDRAGQLTKTVSPEGVDILDVTKVNELKEYRASGNQNLLSLGLQNYYPAHNLEVRYRYNNLGQLIKQHSEDGVGLDGTESRFLYDSKGRLRFSQNNSQKLVGAYSYLKYDNLGRTIEAGESTEAGPLFDDQNIDPTTIIIDPVVLDNINFPSNISLKSEVTYSHYTIPANISYYGKEQRFLRNNISYICKDQDGDLTTTSDQFYTYYSYDPHGNVEWLVQQAPEIGQNYISYEYDLISGKVLKVNYNEFRDDRFFHRYEYDAINRLVGVYTSEDGELWDNDATYDYYLHGPLKRTIIGEDHVQGIDNLYTVNGWLKAVNTPNLSRNQDLGLDGESVTSNWMTTNTAEDMYGMVLGYFEGDYQNTQVTFTDQYTGLYSKDDAQDLFNGNISFWANSRMDNMYKTDFVNASIYRYDVLNRIKRSKNYESNLVNSIPNSTFNEGYMGNSGAFATNYTFDGNGNLKTLQRNDSQGMLMDDLTYDYNYSGGRLIKNQLTQVQDVSAFMGDNGDLKGNHQYVYDERGNLVQDISDELLDLNGTPALYTVTLDITWTVTGKVNSIHKSVKNSLSTVVGLEELNFGYDAMDMRVKKEHRQHFSSDGLTAVVSTYEYLPEEVKTTYYVHDATGNQMAMYQKKSDPEIVVSGEPQTYTVSISKIEQPIYGSSRIGENINPVKIAEATGVLLSENVSFANLESGVQRISEYQNWITSAIKSTSLTDDGYNQICECTVNKIEFEPDGVTEGEFIINPTSDEMVQFLGISENGLAIAENIQGTTQFYAVLVQNYLGSENACLVYDVEGNLMKGIETITNVDVNSKPIILNIPGTNTYNLITLNTSGKPIYHSIDMDAIGYGLLEPRGEIVEANQPAVPSSPVNTKYGWHYTGYEDHINEFSIMYGSRYTPISGQFGKTEIVAVKFENGNDPQEYVLYEIEDCGDTRAGELQISPNGDKLLWYQHGKNIAGFDHRLAEVFAIGLNPDKISANSMVDIINTGDGGNAGRGMLDMISDNQTILYSQRSLYQTDAAPEASRSIWKVNTLVPQDIFSINPLSPDAQYLYSQIRRGKDGKMYMPNMGEMVETLHSYTENDITASELMLTVTDPSAQYLSSLPTQVHKLYSLFEGNYVYSRTVGMKMYELSDHLGNVRVVISDRKRHVDDNGDNVITASVDYFTPEVLSYSDYYPYGMVMPGRHGQAADGYRYGFNGMESDDEVKGNGNSYTTEFRQYDPRIGRWLSLDPLMAKYPWQSPYAAFNNNPIYFVDPFGLEGTNPGEPEKGYTCYDESHDEVITYTGDGSWQNTNDYISGIENQISSNGAKISEMEHMVGYINNRISSNQSAISTNNGLTQQSNDLRSQLSSLEGSLNKLRLHQQGLEDELNEFLIISEILLSGGEILGTNNYDDVSRFLDISGKTAGYLSISQGAIENLGGIDVVAKLIREKQFTTIWNGQTKTWSINFMGNKSVSAEFVATAKSVSAQGKALSIVKAGGVILSVGGAFISTMQYANGDIGEVEFGADLVFTGIAIWGGPAGWVASGLYFMGKEALKGPKTFDSNVGGYDGSYQQIQRHPFFVPRN